MQNIWKRWTTIAYMKDRGENPCHEVRSFNVSSREIDRTEEEDETTEDVGFSPP